MTVSNINAMVAVHARHVAPHVSAFCIEPECSWKGTTYRAGAEHTLETGHDVRVDVVRVYHLSTERREREDSKIVSMMPPGIGVAGGLSVAELVDFARASGIEITEKQVRDLRKEWNAAWPDAVTDHKLKALVGRRVKGSADSSGRAFQTLRGTILDARKGGGDRTLVVVRWDSGGEEAVVLGRDVVLTAGRIGSIHPRVKERSAPTVKKRKRGRR